MTTLVDEHELVKQVDSKLADHARRKADFEARVAPLAEQEQAAEEAYAKAVDAALLEGAPMPEPPVRRLPLGRDVELRLAFLQEQQLLTEERRRAVAAVYPEVLRQARKQAAQRINPTYLADCRWAKAPQRDRIRRRLWLLFAPMTSATRDFEERVTVGRCSDRAGQRHTVPIRCG
jgi:hypothetical protein